MYEKRPFVFFQLRYRPGRQTSKPQDIHLNMDHTEAPDDTKKSAITVYYVETELWLLSVSENVCFLTVGIYLQLNSGK